MVFPSRKIVLPQRVNFVNYLQSHGTEYINTTHIPTGAVLRVSIDFEYTADHSAHSLFGSESSGPRYSIVPWGYPDFYVGGTGQLLRRNIGTNVRTTLDVTANNGTLTVNQNGSVTTAAYSATVNTALPMFLFANNINGSAGQIVSARVYSFKIYDNGTLARDFRPCLDPAGVPCMYDMVSKQYFYNAGSGTFAYG